MRTQIYRITQLAVFSLLSCTGFAANADVGAFIKVVNEGDGFRFAQGTDRFFSQGVNQVTYAEYWPSDPKWDSRKAMGYYSVQANFSHPYNDWAASATARLQSWGFNTAGAWSHDALDSQAIYTTELLPVSIGLGANNLVDVFRDDYPALVDAAISAVCTAGSTRTNLLGYFIGNELPWYGDKAWPSGTNTLLTLYNDLPATAPGKIRLIAFLQEAFPTWAEFRINFSTTANSWAELSNGATLSAWSYKARQVQNKWTGVVAERFFGVYAPIIRSYDPNHLILGARFSSNAPQDVWAAAGKYCDVLSVNYYTTATDAAVARWRSAFAASQKPILITETSWRATTNRSGDLNTIGAPCTVATQADRGTRLQSFATQWLNEPYMIGYHWFQYFDQPPGGRYNGDENSNYGLLDIYDVPYTEVTGANAQVAAAFKTARVAPTTFPVTVDRAQLGDTIKLCRPFDVGVAMAATVNAWDSRLKGTSYLSYDTAHGATGTSTKGTDGLTCVLGTGTGWSTNIVLQGASIISAPNSRYISIKSTVTAGAIYRIVLVEKTITNAPPTNVIVTVSTSLNPNDNAVCKNPNADGEFYMSPNFIGTGTADTVVLDLQNIAIDLYHGSQSGDNSLDLANLNYIAFQVASKQGTVTVLLDSLTWQPAGAPYTASPAP